LSDRQCRSVGYRCPIHDSVVAECFEFEHGDGGGGRGEDFDGAYFGVAFGGYGGLGLGGGEGGG
jgi:hypothetical protein